MRRTNLLGVVLALGAASLAGADDAASTPQDNVTAADDDIAEFVLLAAKVLTSTAAQDDDDTSEGVDTDARLRRHLGLGFAQGLDSDPTGLYTDNCRGNGHSGVFINSFGYHDCGDPSPSD